MRHPEPADLALYGAGDLPLWPRIQTAVHLRGCGECRSLVEAFRGDRTSLRSSAGDLPEGVDWDHLAAEMTANIHLGLAAGECVSPQTARAAKPQVTWDWNWRPAAIVAGLMLVMSLAWWLNMPRGDTEALGRVAKTLWTRGPFGVPSEEPGPTVEASPAGIEFSENGRSMGLGLTDEQPVTSSVSLQGSASAQYVDDDTGQVTITAVYVQ